MSNRTSSPALMREPSNASLTNNSLFELNAAERKLAKQKDFGISKVTYCCEPPSQLREKEEIVSKNKQCTVKYQNSYRIETHRFPIEKIEPVINKILEDRLNNEKYDAAKAGELCKELAEQIKNKTLALNCPRFKIVACVNIGENSHQDVRCGTKMLCNQNQDNYGSAIFSNQSLFAIGSIYAFYYE